MKPGPREGIGERVLVVGAGLSGEAVAKLLAREGIEVTVSDRRSEAEIGPAAGRIRRLGGRLETGPHRADTFRRHDWIVVSPGVPPDLEVLREARRRGARVISEVELAYRRMRGMAVGITGTNGKSTSTKLLGAILAAAGRDTTVCGNIGVPFSAALAADGPEVIHCVELSSFQLEGIETFRPRIAILLNVRPDHQDRYHDAAAYAAAKARIFENQGPADHAILNAADPAGRSLAGRLRAHLHVVDSTGVPAGDGAGLDGDTIVVRRDGASEAVLERGDIPLPGNHNLENVLACVVAARLLGAGIDPIGRAIREFRALPHRMERLGEVGGVAFWNDSKATNVDAVRRALESFPGGVHLILGGRDKGGDFTQLRDPIRARARRLVLVGEARPLLRAALEGLVPIEERPGLEEAVEEAFRGAGAGEVVLLSPGCASFDAYGSFRERGDHFRRIVDRLRRKEGR